MTVAERSGACLYDQKTPPAKLAGGVLRGGEGGSHFRKVTVTWRDESRSSKLGITKLRRFANTRRVLRVDERHRSFAVFELRGFRASLRLRDPAFSVQPDGTLGAIPSTLEQNGSVRLILPLVYQNIGVLSRFASSSAACLTERQSSSTSGPNTLACASKYASSNVSAKVGSASR